LQSIQSEIRPRAKMPDPSPLVSEGEADLLPKLAINREAFYGTRKGKSLFAISLAAPETHITIKLFDSGIRKIKKAEILGKGKIKFKQTPVGLNLVMPEQFSPENGYLAKIQLK
ncbi:unnamed protein product, partial [marine sediment metagenome]